MTLTVCDLLANFAQHVCDSFLKYHRPAVYTSAIYDLLWIPPIVWANVLAFNRWTLGHSTDKGQFRSSCCCDALSVTVTNVVNRLAEHSDGSSYFKTWNINIVPKEWLNSVKRSAYFGFIVAIKGWAVVQTCVNSNVLLVENLSESIRDCQL